METKNLFVQHNGLAYAFKATELSVTNNINDEILRYRIELSPSDIILIEQDRYNNWVQLVEKGSLIYEDLLQKIGEAILKAFLKS